MDRLVKAKSDGSLASTTTTATVTDASLNKMKSRSLEPLTGLAMWSSEPQIIELVKGERGLGFSILDYQDPMNPNETVIVIRSLVPGGVAQVDGQLIPGDRLLFVNDIALENATLDQAVQALKGAPKGTVRIGVAKPLPIPDSIVQVSDQEDRIEPTADRDSETATCSIMDSHKQRREYFRERKVNVIEPPHHMDLIEGLKHQHNLVKSESF